jgi:hypothetical protein
VNKLTWMFTSKRIIIKTVFQGKIITREYSCNNILQ